MPFEVTVLGSASAIPTSTRNQSAQLVNLLGRFFLIDCGEGTQIQLRKNKIKIQKIDFICISHLHGDHYLGLVGLLSTMSLLNRQKDLTVFGPKGLDKIIQLHCKLSHSKLSYKLKFIHLQGSRLELIHDDDRCQLFSFGLKHGLPCWGFKLIEKKKQKKILKSMIDKYAIPVSCINDIKSGANYVTQKGKLILNNILTVDSYLPRSYAYCSDTYYFKSLANYIKDVDLLYYESTFHSTLSGMAKSTLHSTSEDAGRMALNAKVKKLIIGHFSSRYKDLDILKEDAKKVFHNVELALEGKTFKIEKIYLT
tara:strand:+ start:360 stop:1289 length:930 start_codon:yes stop_codon:yes gene_type:complete